MKFNKKINFMHAIFMLFAIITTKIFAQETRTRYIVVYHDGLDPFKRIVNISLADLSLLMHADKKNFVGATLTKDEVKYLLRAVGRNGVVTRNDIFFLDDTINPHGEKKVTLDTEGSSVYLIDTPKCITPLNNVDFVVIDTLMATDNPELSNINITLGPNFTPHQKSCNIHAEQVASVIAGNNVGVVPQGNRTIYNIATFNCVGLSYAENIIKSFNAALEFHKKNACNGRSSVVNFSGIGTLNEAVNLAATAVVNADIPLFIAAGNSGINICNTGSPIMAKKVFTIGSSSPPGNIPTNFTNYGTKCVEMFLPGEGISVVSKNGITKIDGTSFSSPIGAALGGIELGIDSDATPKEVSERILARPRTVIVIPPTNAFFHTPMKIMLAAYACPAESRLFNHFVAKKNHSQQPVWYNGIRNNIFCISFNAKSDAGSILLKLRNNVTSSNLVTIKIGDSNHLYGKFVNTISQDGVKLDGSNIAPSLLSRTTTAIFTIIADGQEIKVTYAKEDGVQKPLLFAPIHQKMQDVLFDGLGGNVKYNNALKCVV